MDNSPEMIAIIGLACRFPGASDAAEFWRNLRDGLEATTHFDDETLRQAGVTADLLADPRYVKANGVLADVEQFDAAFFGLTPREAEITDPQQRLFLECAWEALEVAGYDPARYADRIGVYGGAGLSTYLLRHLTPQRDQLGSVSDFQLLMGNNKDFVPTRVSYKLDLRGPSVNVNTACSTSLVATHLACQALLDYQTDIALAGGVGIQLPQISGYLYEEGNVLSPDGHCRPFDARAQGTVSGNGVGLVVLKRLSEALDDGDTIWAVIRGSAVNNDGAHKVGFTAPSVDGQAQVIAEALSLAEVTADTIDYVEAHGTGTPLGDPIEVRALTQVFQTQTNRMGYCALGSVKSNIGHVDEAAGVAGLIKTVLALRHEQLPPSLNFATPNPKLKLDETPFFVNDRLRPWPATDTPRRAGVSSFGIGGTNAHVVLQEAPSLAHDSHARPHHLFLLSAKTPTALQTTAQRLADHLQAHPDLPLADVAYTLAVGRQQFPYRHALVVRNTAEAISALRQLIPSTTPAAVSPAIVWMLTGQGAQYAGMGQAVYEHEPVFRHAFDTCVAHFQPHLDRRVDDLLWRLPDDERALIDQTQYAQPALFALEYALAQLWQSWGIAPHSLIGHSLGEYVAACLAGVLDLADACRLVAVRGRVMQVCPPGEMLAVSLSAADLQPYLRQGVSLAAVNAPTQCVVSGTTMAVADLEQTLTAAGIVCRRLHTSHAFHSPLMAEAMAPLTAAVEQTARMAPQIPYVSNVTGQWITVADTLDATYWATHLRQPVRFAEGLQTILSNVGADGGILLEIGPGRTLATLAQRQNGDLPISSWPSLPAAKATQNDHATLLHTLGQLWQGGAAIDWPQFYATEARRRIPLPTYPFERQRYWVDPPHPDRQASQKRPAKAADLRDWFYTPVWKRTPWPVEAHQSPQHWLIFHDGSALGEAFISHLHAGGQAITIAHQQGDHFQRLGEHAFALNLAVPAHFDQLASALEARPPEHIVCFPRLTCYENALSIVQTFASADRRLTLLTEQACDVRGREPNDPLQAMALGVLKVAQQEYVAFRCQQIDLTADTDVALLEVALLADTADLLVALRDGQRWVQVYEPWPLPEAPSAPLKQGSTYLITGGWGGIGLIAADYLARTTQANLALLGRTPFPDRATWGHYFPSNLPDDFLATNWFFSRETAWREALAIRPLADYDGLVETLDQLCASYVIDYLRLEAGLETTIEALHRKVRLLPKFAKCLNFFLHFLVEDGLIHLEDGVIRCQPSMAAWPSAEELEQQLKSQYPEFTGLFGLLKHCVQHYPQALSGDMEAIHVLYPDGYNELLDSFARLSLPYSQREIYTHLLRDIVMQAAHAAEGPLRLLEFGAGEGILSGLIAEAIQGVSIEYTVTDLGRSFVLQLERQAAEAGLEQLHFGTLDITQHPIGQEYTPHQYDLVFGLDVIHATPDLAVTVAQLKTLLAPGGMLALVESVQPQRWIDMIWGLADGWWYFDDYARRPRTPLMTIGQWRDLSIEQGFAEVQTYPDTAEQVALSDYGLIVGQQSASPVSNPALRPKIEIAYRLEATGSTLLPLAADVVDENAMRHALTQIEEHFGELNGVIHAAGDTRGEAIFNLIADTTPIQIEQTFRARVHGTQILGKLLAHQPLDFCLLISSNAATLGGLGLNAYASATTFMDAWAIAHGWLSANWDSWPTEQFLGREVMVQTSIDQYGMTLAEAQEALERVLAYGQGQVVVSAGDLQARQALWTQAPTRVIEGTAETTRATNGQINSFHGRPSLSTPYQAAQHPIEQQLVEIWQAALGITPVGIQDNFFELGGDSLLVAQIMAQTHRATQVELPLSVMFEQATIAQLAARIQEIQAAIQQLQTAPATALAAEEEEGEI